MPKWSHGNLGLPLRKEISKLQLGLKNYKTKQNANCDLCCRRVVSGLLLSPQWPTLLRQCWGSTTPFRELIKKMPGTVNSCTVIIALFSCWCFFCNIQVQYVHIMHTTQPRIYFNYADNPQNARTSNDQMYHIE